MTAALHTDDPALAAFAEAVGTEGPVAVRGGGTRWDLGGSVDPAARLVTAPSGIVDYTPAEMTVTVRAGTTVADLHAALAEAGQITALPERGGTVGGAVAVAENDLCQRWKGTVAAAALQVRYVSAEGRLVTGGGPTVKNVTGFDLPRLLCGSLGTLGCLAEVTLRTNPVPEVSRWLTAEDADPFAVNDRLLRPGVVLWNGDRVWVLLQGYGPDVEAEVEGLGALGSFAATEGPPPLPPHRWSLRPSDLRRLAGAAFPGPQRAGTGGTPPQGTDGGPTAMPDQPFVASIGVGLVWAGEAQPGRSLEPVVASIAARTKANFDPTGRLNPGRSPGRP
jgi:glycolate oxidase FAD binding subunit